MDRDQIQRFRTDELPHELCGPGERLAWTGLDGRVIYQIVRQDFHEGDIEPHLMLSVTGVRSERQNLIGQFLDAYGEPSVHTADEVTNTETVVWLLFDSSQVIDVPPDVTSGFGEATE